MKVEFEKNSPDRIASDDAGGRFYCGKDGSILYIGPDELDPWYVNADLEKFRSGVQAFENYRVVVQQKKTEQEQLNVVATFREAILRIEDYGGQKRSYWASIVQQAEEGQI